jgi:tetratricopeptide (TPR) repeat protein
LSAAIEQPVPIETEATRESFLQAARFVGRDEELGQLLEALLNAREANVGGTWLVAGESGVGKSRLMDEVRIRALIRGAAVIRGQAVSDGGSPYEVWRRGLRRLALSTPLTDAQAGVLKPLIPDIDRLLEREITEAPELDSPAAQQRLITTVGELLTALVQEQENPVVILLEDLQWTGAESLELFKALNQLAADLPLLVIGSYRDDEQPDLPQQLPEMNIVKLNRLSSTAIAELSESMLGVAGRQEEVLTLLNRETEGNPFFLVEVVRALAEEAGRLDKIGSRTLPAHVFTGGLQRLVKRRLNRVPVVYWPLLQLSAVAGREIDLRVLRAIEWEEARPDLEAWLTECVNAAVLQKQGDQWRFAHDKLREGLLADIAVDTLRQMHQGVAQAIEKAYVPNESEAARLSYHWSMAGNLPQAARYAVLAGDQAMRVGANAEAKNFFERAIDTLARLAPTAENRQQLVDTTLKLSRVAAFSPGENMQQLLQQALETAEALGDEIRLAYVYSSIGAFHYIGTRMNPAFDNFSRGVALAEQLGLERLLMLPYNLMGRALCNMGAYGRSAEMLAKGIPLAKKFGDMELFAGSLAFYAATLYYQGKWDEAEKSAEQALKAAEALGHPSRIAGNLMVLGFVLGFCGHFERAIDYLEHSIEVASRGEALALHVLNLSHGCLGYIYLQQGQYEAATKHLDRCLELAQGKEQLLAHLPMYEGFRAEITLQEGDGAGALAQAKAALLRAEQTEQPVAQAQVQQSMCRILAAGDSPDWEQIEGLLRDSIAFHENGPALSLAAVGKFELGQVYAQQGLKERSQEMFNQALRQFETLRMTWHIAQAEEVIARAGGAVR